MLILMLVHHKPLAAVRNTLLLFTITLLGPTIDGRHGDCLVHLADSDETGTLSTIN